MSTIAEQLAHLPQFNRMILPDLWQQQAVAALRRGEDVVVQAPTSAGKTLIFELWSHQGKARGPAVYTVPTRALANDKLAEWRARGWNVGIATGDLSDNLDAPILVATLETQKQRLIRGLGPALLVVDEYQMIGDPDRGLNYELALALAPPQTQLLLLSGSVANPQDIVRWLTRLGRRAVLVRQDVRPVPLDEVLVEQLSYSIPLAIRGYWPRVVAKALAEGLGPILLFAPRRQAAEGLAIELARYLPNPHPLALSPIQKQLVGDSLARLLKCRIAYHHSGLSYAARAGVIEPLAKCGQLRVVVATMGLAAGINFSLRSVALAGESYRRDLLEQPLRPDEILQMFGRAGRRGIDETGFVLVTANQIRMRDAHPIHLSRCGMVDWNTLLSLMDAAAAQGLEPYAEAVRIQTRLFSAKPIFLGVEHSLESPDTPCGLKTDAERARHVRHRIRQLRNSRGQWQPYPPCTEHPLADIRVLENAPPPDPGSHGTDDRAAPVRLRPALSVPAALERAGAGALVVLDERGGLPTYGRAVTVAERLDPDRLVLPKWIRRLIQWPRRQVAAALWPDALAPRIRDALAGQRTPLVRFDEQPHKILACVSLAQMTLRVPADAHGVPLWRPPERQVMSPDCAGCSHADDCRQWPTATGVAMLWRRLGLVDTGGVPTRRGRIVSFFSQGDGLAIAAALEDLSYPVEELVYDLANLDAGFRFCGEDNRWGGRLANACHRLFGLHTVPGYLENGLPPKYGDGAGQIVASIHQNPLAKHECVTDQLGPGDIDRIVIEWRSLLRRIAHAPALDDPRWQKLQSLARTILHETHSPTLVDLPPLEYDQTRRIDHCLILRRS
ncbi:MAG: DEAD/DEAH box helicase [Verrucomicrobia bacterium]|nr:DEAD/DEAH box helicase [Verrucomicrobiota bacterium]